MTRTLEILGLAALVTVTVTVTACDSPDRDVDDAAPRDKVLRTDPASLEALAELEDSEAREMVTAQLGLDSEQLLDMALDPAASPDLQLTAPPAPTAADSCVGITDILDFCVERKGAGVNVWVKIIGVSSGKDYLGAYGVCDGGGVDAEIASAEYVYCYLALPVPQVVFVAEACYFGSCEDVGHVWVL